MKLKNPHQRDAVSFIIIFYYAAILLKAKTLKIIIIVYVVNIKTFKRDLLIWVCCNIHCHTLDKNIIQIHLVYAPIYHALTREHLVYIPAVSKPIAFSLETCGICAL